MTERVAEILELAERLTAEERAEFLDRLLVLTGPSEDEPVEDGVAQEAVRRLREIQRGEAGAIPASVVFDELRKRFAAKSA